MSKQETPEMLVYRAQQKAQMILHKGYICDLCGRFANTQHEILFRSSTLNNEEARQLSFQEELCANLCEPCHANAHTLDKSAKLLIKNAKIYGSEAVEVALQAVQAVLKGKLGIALLKEEVDGC